MLNPCFDSSLWTLVGYDSNKNQCFIYARAFRSQKAAEDERKIILSNYPDMRYAVVEINADFVTDDFIED